MTVTPARAAYVLARGFDYFGGALFLGGLAFLVLLWPEGAAARGARRVVTAGWVFGLLGTVAAIGLEGVWVTGGPLNTDLLARVLDLDFGRVWFARALLWVLAGVVLVDLLRRGERAARSGAWRVGAGAVGLGLLRTNGMVGHALDAPRPLWAQLAGLVHLTGIVLWVGGLAVLLIGVLPRREPDELAHVVPRYSRLAMVSVALIVAGGLVLAWQVVGSVGAVLSTDYGHLLLVKLGIFALVLGIAQVSRHWVAHRLDVAVESRGDAATVRPFVYSVAAETTLVVFVIVAASLLVTASPGR